MSFVSLLVSRAVHDTICAVGILIGRLRAFAEKQTQDLLHGRKQREGIEQGNRRHAHVRRAVLSDLQQQELPEAAAGAEPLLQQCAEQVLSMVIVSACILSLSASPAYCHIHSCAIHSHI